MDRTATGGAVRRHLKNPFAPVAAVFFHLHNRRNDLAGLFDQNHVADADVLALDFLLVVQSRPGDGAARNKNRFQLGNRRERSRAADLNRDVEQLRFGPLRLVFVGNRPAGSFCRGAELPAQRHTVEFHHRAIGLVGESVTDAPQFLDRRDDGFLVMGLKNFFRDRQTPFFEATEHLAARGRLLPLPDSSAIKNSGELASGGNRRIQLLD